MTIPVTDQLTISNISAFKEQLGAEALNGDDLVLDLGNLEGIDVTGLQLLLSLLHPRGASPAKCTLVNPNEIFTRAVDGYGLVQQFS